MRYDADETPDVSSWSAAEDDDRVEAIRAHHDGMQDALHRDVTHLHLRLHLVVENQAADGHEAVCSTLDRLTAEGLRRHAAVHMIMEVMARSFVELAKGGAWSDAHYAEQLAVLDAGRWIGARMRQDLGPVDLD